MNKRALLRTAKAIETAQFATLGFNMRSFYDGKVGNYDPDQDTGGRDCGTCACIGGWAVAANGSLKELKRLSLRGGIGDRARDILGLTYGQRRDLFGSYTNNNITPEIAVTVLRHFAETGLIEFQAALEGDLS